MEASSSSSSSSSSTSIRDFTHSALQLVHWKEPKKSAAAFGVSLLVLVSVATLSVISVVSYLLLTVLCITITFRSLLDRDISVSPEAIRLLVDRCLVLLNHFTDTMRKLLLVEDMFDSLKLAAVMWIMTYVGAIFNGVSILILADIIFFSTPLIYQKKKTQIDQYIELIRSRVEETLQKVQDRLPGAVRRSKAE
ncbi:reticulon-3-like isoform X2 [Perca fluviatilis]|uniref:reticulon-3-like isoform X2 n=1 Tax=Perca fluviatilis TaxID=8168 RepID=UPI0019666A1B|nr:reticulon-3-like isoform X2 [Perca fluviatilis]